MCGYRDDTHICPYIYAHIGYAFHLKLNIPMTRVSERVRVRTYSVLDQTETDAATYFRGP